MKCDPAVEAGTGFPGIGELASGRNLHVVKTRYRDKWRAEVLLSSPGRNAARCKYSCPLRYTRQCVGLLCVWIIFRLYTRFGFGFPYCEF